MPVTVFLNLCRPSLWRYDDPMLRRLFAIFFIFANLSMQVSVAFSCGMMGGATVVLKHCCCHSGKSDSDCNETTMAKGCCQQVVQVADGPGDQIGGLHAATKLPDYNPQPLPPALVPVLLSLVLLPAQDHESIWDEVRDHGLYGTDLYLRTQRLRL